MTGSETLAGRYQLRGLLGCGGMAEVRDAWDIRLNRPVAVKLLHPNFNADADARARFCDEARSAAALSHPNIVAVHDFGEHEGRPFIVMERLPGRTLADLIAQGPMSPPQVRSMLDDVLAALDVAHTAGVVHRDVKPANILLSAAGDRWQVADFGIAKSGGAAHTMTGQIVGTLCYMSPERVSGAPASVADDIYAVGVMGYEALLARRAFPQENPVALARAIADAPPPALAELTSGADPVLAAVVDRAMSRDPRLRFGSAGQMRAGLAGDVTALSTPAAGPRPATKVLAAPLPPSAAYSSSPPPRPHRPVTHARRYLIAAAVLIAFVISALALAMDPFSSTTPPPQPVGTSTSVTPPTPTTSAPPPPPPAPPITAATQEEQQEGPEGKGPRGNGRGNGKGNGGKKD